MKRITLLAAFLAKDKRKSVSLMTFSIQIDKSLGLLFSACKPSSPSLMMERGYHGQSKATTGKPHAITSRITKEKPSYLKLNTQIELSTYFSMILST